MRLMFLATLCALIGGASAHAQAPAACQPDARGGVDFQACAEAAPPGSPERALALINLGTQAFLQNDYATAVKRYDEAVPPGQTILSDARFHAYRGAAYERVGREDEALEDARLVLRMLAGAQFPGTPRQAPAYDPEELLVHVLPILRRADDAAYPAALAAFRGLPARDWISHANRAAVLMQVGDLEGALAANAAAMKLEPRHPAVLNNACYLLAKVGRAAEGLPHCEQAAAAAPEVAAVRDSYATALEALGRCAEAEAQLREARRLDNASVEYRRTLACAGR